VLCNPTEINVYDLVYLLMVKYTRDMNDTEKNTSHRTLNKFLKSVNILITKILRSTKMESNFQVFVNVDSSSKIPFGILHKYQYGKFGRYFCTSSYSIGPKRSINSSKLMII